MGKIIVVRRAGENMKFTTLDEVERDIIPSDTMVCDAEGPASIAGIMGGLDSGIADTTSRIFLEAANWVDAEVRRTSTRLGLRTDALQRYEKSLDSQMLDKTIYRLVELIKESCPEATVVGGIVEDNMPEYTPLIIKIYLPSRVCQVLGKEIPGRRDHPVYWNPLISGIAREGDSSDRYRFLPIVPPRILSVTRILLKRLEGLSVMII